MAHENNLDQLYFKFTRIKTDVSYSDEKGKIDEFSLKNVRLFDNAYDLLKTLHPEDYIWRFIVKRETLLRSGAEFVPNTTFEEICFNYFLNKQIGKCATIDNEIYFYRIGREGSATNSYNSTRRRKYIKSRMLLAKYYDEKINVYKALKDKKTVKELKAMRHFDLQGAISLVIAEGDVKFTKEVLKELKCKNDSGRKLYPYVAIKNFIPQKSLRKTLINYVALLYPFEWYVKFLTWMSSKRKK